MRKIWSVLLAMVMLMSLLPMNAFAQVADVVGETNEIEGSAEIINSGSCGDNITWVLDSTGLLEITGTGDMDNWSFFGASAPWIYDSDQIKKVVIGEGVTSIGQNAFCSEDSYYDENDHFYSALTEIVIPNTVTTIQTNGLSGLDVLETIKLPASVTTLVGAAFNNNYGLKNFVVSEENPVFKSVNGVLYSKDGKTLVSYPIGSTAESYSIPQGTETIAAYAFSQCSPVLKEVVFNEELTFLDDEAFHNCDGLTKIHLPDSVKELGGGVFQECSNLIDIELPNGMTRIGGRAFDATGYYNDWSNWEDNVLYIGPYLLETTYITPELDWDEWKEKSGTLAVRAGTTLIADESVDGSTVDAVIFNNGLEHIGFAAFYGLNIATVSLPDSLISLGDWAFYSCELLNNIHIGPNLQYIGHDALGNTPYDTDENYVDGVLYYGPYVLGFNEDLPNDVVLRAGTTIIAERAFWKEDGRLNTPDYGAGMETITFPESLTTICDGAFYSCSNLKTITIPATVTYIGDQAYGWVKGYDLDIDEETFTPMTDVTIKGYNETAAHVYATENDIPFILLDHEHSYDNACDAECNDCGDVREAGHTYNGDCDTECNVCFDIREVNVDHTFDNNCDGECNICGATREITHNYNIRKYDDDYHWFECECGAIDIENRYGHGYSRYFNADEHWLECFCGHKIENAPHEYDNAIDPICNVCEDEREITFSGWFAEGGKWYFYENGNMVTNKWKADSNGWCYLGSDGAMKTNAWVMDSLGWCYVGANGYCVTNKWMQDSTKKWCYLNANGNMVVNNWVLDGSKWYFMDVNGYMVTNKWMKDSIGWVYLGTTGSMATNSWAKDSYGWCYVGANGYAVTNTWKMDSHGWCYLGASGSQVKNNWVLSGGKWYFLDEEGYMLANTSKWIKDKTYHFNASGVCTNP